MRLRKAPTGQDLRSHQRILNERDQLGAEHFEQVQMLKFPWCKSLVNSAQANSGIVEEVLLNEYKDLLVDEDMVEWENEAGEVHSTYCVSL
jgi:hypothetical protein